MDEYIKKQVAIDALTERNLVVHMGSVNDGLVASCHRSAQRIIANIPAADVRPVVLCRECVHWERYDNTAGCGYCHKVKFEYGADGYVFNPVRAPDFYCADGEKREES